MGLMQPVPESRLILTPHPVTLDGRRNLVAELREGDTLAAFLARAVPEEMGGAWEVRINGVLVPHEVMGRVRPKPGTVIEVRSTVGKQALAIIAMAALTYFTFGFGAATAGMWGAGAAAGAFGGGLAGALFATAVYAGGSMLINKVLGPKPPSASTRDPNPVYSIGMSRNTARHYQPLPLVFGTVRYAPDIVSNPYWWFEGGDQYVGMVLTPGINAHSIETLYNGDTPLSTFQGVAVYLSGFGGHADQGIPLYSNADTVDGGELPKDVWVSRTTSEDTVRVQINLDYLLGDITSKGKDKANTATVSVEYRPAGGGSWTALGSREFANNNYDPKRATLSYDVPRGQYDVRVRRTGGLEIENAKAEFHWSNMTCVQQDTADYAGIPRIGVRIKASGQLSGGALDELRCVVHSTPIPVWNGTAWNTAETSNPGAQILAYARGIEDENGKRIAGIGLPDSMIDIPALQAFILHCAAEGYTYDFVVREPRSHAEMLDTLALAGFGHITWSSGKLSVAWAAEDQPLSGVVNMATIKRGTFQVDYSLSNPADAIEYTYYDSTDWTTKTLRVNAPGVTIPLNPAQVQGEGVTSEAHAAQLARWHMAQHLYQYKDITYQTDLEHLSYRRMDVLALQHDLTQWGYGGRVAGAVDDGGTVTLTLDEPVPAPPSGTPYIGLRIPGEASYRVFAVTSFAGTTNELTLADPWPSGVAFPGDEGNPAHDTIWVYDFKATPGYRVRVVGMQPDADYEGATVSVVPESPELWTYVKTGEYVPPANQSLLANKPTAHDLVITEAQVVQGNTVFTELTATWQVTGPLEYCLVQGATYLIDTWTDLVPVAETRTLQAKWRVPGAGTYKIRVMPYAPDGRPGVPAEEEYSTIGADAPPPVFDWFEIDEVGGGLRRYSWGYDVTPEPPDLAGAEIRYIAGNVPDPDWDELTVLGEGFYTGAFELTTPAEEGTFTFVIRSRDTSGQLSIDQLVVVKALAEGMGGGGPGFFPLFNPSFEDDEGWGCMFGTPNVYHEVIGPSAPAVNARSAAYSTAKSRSGNRCLHMASNLYGSMVISNRRDDANDLASLSTVKFARFVQPSSLIRLSCYVANDGLAFAANTNVITLQLQFTTWNKVTGARHLTYTLFNATYAVPAGTVIGDNFSTKFVAGPYLVSDIINVSNPDWVHAITAVQITVPSFVNGGLYIDDVVVEATNVTDVNQPGFNYDADGNVIGTYNPTKADTDSASFLTKAFRLTETPGALQGTEITNGVLRTFRNGQQVVIGPGFGTTGKLMFYMGQDDGIAGADPANADLWFDSDGNTGP